MSFGRSLTRGSPRKGKNQPGFLRKRKLVVQGKGTQEFVEFVLEPQILQEARLGYEAILNPDLLVARLGVDESGKGDFFGPLCIAGVYVNEKVVKSWPTPALETQRTFRATNESENWPS